MPLVGIPLLPQLLLGHYVFLDEPLFFAVREGDIAHERRLLNLWADPNVTFKGCSLLAEVAASGDADQMLLLLHYGADPEGRGGFDDPTALEAAEANKHQFIAAMLKKAGATR